MRGYPVGSICIITWVENPSLISSEVCIVSEPYLRVPGAICPDGYEIRSLPGRDGMVQQIVVGGGRRGGHPVAWMRPLSDPDAVKETEGELIHE